MTAIFHELIKDSMEVFMDDFSIFGSSFNHYLKNLEKMLKRCEETNLVLNWEKCHFMVKEGIVLGHKVLGSGIEVDKAKIMAIKAFLDMPVSIEEFDIEIHNKKGAENLAANHLSRLENPDLGKLTRAEIRDLFPEERLMAISDKGNEPWYADYANYLASRLLPFLSTHQEKQKFFSNLRHYFWDEPFIFKQCADRIIRRCVGIDEAAQILQQCHSGPS
ncbi:hypothetical protein Tco_0594690 [Tanacetum coccineum]